MEAGNKFCVVLTENAEGKREFYGVGLKIREMYDRNSNVFPDRFGPNAKAVYGSCIYQLADIDADAVASFACTEDAVCYVLKDSSKKPVSIIPEKPDASGLIHFYREGDQWVFLDPEEYEAKKDSLPKVCFATRHPIADFSAKPWPDLGPVAAGLQLSAAENEPTYYSKFTFGVDADDREQ